MSTAKKKRKGRFTVQVTWDAGVDTGSGVAAYHLYRDGVEIADISNLSYIDTNVIDGVIYSYALAAVDYVGNESDLCSPVAYPLDSSDGEPDDSGSTGSKGYGKGGKPK